MIHLAIRYLEGKKSWFSHLMFSQSQLIATPPLPPPLCSPFKANNKLFIAGIVDMVLTLLRNVNKRTQLVCKLILILIGIQIAIRKVRVHLL